MQPRKAQLGERGADEVGILLAPRSNVTFHQRWLSHLHNAAAQSYPADTYQPLTRDKIIICHEKCNPTHASACMHMHVSCYLGALRLVQGGNANITK